MLIGITGAKGSGKDTFAAVLVEKNFYNLKMAAPLKDLLRALYRYAGVDEATIERKLEGDLKEVPCRILSGQTPRYAMQTLGTEWRNLIGTNLWSTLWLAKAEALLMEGTPIVCTDIRFRHECDQLKALGGYLIRIERAGHDIGDQHSSETEMLGLGVDVTIYNDGSIDRLRRKAEAQLKELSA